MDPVGIENQQFVAAAAAQRLAKEAGFALCGIADAAPSGYADFFAQWLAAGKHGEMGYLADHAAVRVDPGKLVERAASVIVVADAYRGLEPAAPPSNEQQGRPQGRIAKYAWGDDYHKTIKKRLHAMCDALAEQYTGHAFRATTDTAPIFERELATRAGLGWTGKHTLMIHPRLGSYFLLGTIVTTLPMQTSELAGFPAPLSPPTDHCGSCTRCIDACPTDAIAREGYSVDATRCISYLTLEHRSAIDPALHAGMGEWVAGCDICQDVCPHNRRRLALEGQDGPTADHESPLAFHPRYTPRAPAPTLDLLAVLDWNEDDRRAAFAGSALKRVKLDMLKRNVLIALNHTALTSQRPEIRGLIHAYHDRENLPPLVRDTTIQILNDSQ